MPTMKMQRMGALEVGTLLDVRWDTCIFLGIRLHTTEKIIGASKGVVVVQSVRKPGDQQWDVEFLQSIQGTLWAPNPSTARDAREALELPEPLAISVEQPGVAPEETKTASYKARFKRVYLAQDDFDRSRCTANWEAAIKEVMLKIGSTQAKSSSWLY